MKPKKSKFSLVYRSVIVWFVIIAAESVHGILRRLLLEPLIGDFRARQIGVFFGAAIIFCIACAFVRWLKADNAKMLLGVGVLWTILTILFEFGLGRLAFDYSWERILSDYNISAGGLMLFGLMFLTFAPLLAAKVRGVLPRARPPRRSKSSVKRISAI